jgi:hypothetical protein
MVIYNHPANPSSRPRPGAPRRFVGLRADDSAPILSAPGPTPAHSAFHLARARAPEVPS